MQGRGWNTVSVRTPRAPCGHPAGAPHRPAPPRPQRRCHGVPGAAGPHTAPHARDPLAEGLPQVPGEGQLRGSSKPCPGGTALPAEGAQPRPGRAPRQAGSAPGLLPLPPPARMRHWAGPEQGGAPVLSAHWRAGWGRGVAQTLRAHLAHRGRGGAALGRSLGRGRGERRSRAPIGGGERGGARAEAPPRAGFPSGAAEGSAMEGPRSWPSSGGAGRPLTEDEMAEVKKDVSGGGTGGPVPGAGAERQVGPVRGRGAEALRERAGDAARGRREERERRVRGGGGDFSPAVGCGAITAGEHLSRGPESRCAVCPRPAWAEGRAPGPGTGRARVTWCPELGWKCVCCSWCQ